MCVLLYHVCVLLKSAVVRGVNTTPCVCSIVECCCQRGKHSTMCVFYCRVLLSEG